MDGSLFARPWKKAAARFARSLETEKLRWFLVGWNSHDLCLYHLASIVMLSQRELMVRVEDAVL